MAANSPNPPQGDPPQSEAELLAELEAVRETVEEGLLSENEVFWRDHTSWFKDHGYVLRPRYQPGWVASWKAKEPVTGGFVEDMIRPPGARILDAVRTSDGLPVLFKKKEVDEDAEIRIIQKFSSEPLASDPKNHCVRLIEILNLPDTESTKLIVIPLLFDWRHPHFNTIGEAVEFISQIFEGLEFMHTHHVWHGDCKFNNIMMDSTPIRVSSVHPFEETYTSDLRHKARYRNRTGNPVQYYWIDFDLSGEHDPSKGPPLTRPNYGGTRDVPEFAFPDRKCDPFAVDVWCLGNVIRQFFTQGWRFSPKRRGFQFMEPLVADMTHEDPTKRPSMDDVVRRFSEIKVGLSQWKLRSRFAEAEENILVNIFKSTAHWANQLRLVARQIPAVPSP
ncbi:kinase-like domain-containing protein [Mycena epipterygia]|nr:kinase-like domain-containing protein [Mycena epipterygia]